MLSSHAACRVGQLGVFLTSPEVAQHTVRVPAGV